MKYITGHVWLKSKNQKGNSQICNDQPGLNLESILLQQIRYGKINVVLACVCDGGVLGGYITGRLKMWLQSKGKDLFGSRKDSEQVKKELYRELKELQEDVQNYSARTIPDATVNLSGILIADQDCYLIHGGESCCYLLNRRFERTHRRKLGEGKYQPWQVTEGRIQKNVGILLGLKPFLHGVNKDAMLQCLAAQEIEREGQIASRLTELVQESRRQGYEGECSAVYIRSI